MSVTIFPGFASGEIIGNSLASGIAAAATGVGIVPVTALATAITTGATAILSPVLFSGRVGDTVLGIAGTTSFSGLLSSFRSLAGPMPFILSSAGFAVAAIARVFNPVWGVNSLASITPTFILPILGEIQGILGTLGSLTRFFGVDSFGSVTDVVMTSVPATGLMDTVGAGAAHAITGIATGGGGAWLP